MDGASLAVLVLVVLPIGCGVAVYFVAKWIFWLLVYLVEGDPRDDDSDGDDVATTAVFTFKVVNNDEDEAGKDQDENQKASTSP